MFVLCAAISECNNKQHSPLHVELPLRKIAANISDSNFNRCHGWQLQNPAFVQIETIAPLTIRTFTRPLGVGRTFRAPQCYGVRKG